MVKQKLHGQFHLENMEMLIQANLFENTTTTFKQYFGQL